MDERIAYMERYGYPYPPKREPVEPDTSEDSTTTKHEPIWLPKIGG